MSETVTLPFPAKPRNRSIEARRAKRVEKALKERRIVDFLNRGVSVAEIAAREGVTEKRMRAAVREILARRMPEAPAEYAALQVSRLSEALLVAYSAMSVTNLKAVECVVRIVREMDRYHGFAAAGRPAPRDGRGMEIEAQAPLALLADGPRRAPQATGELGREVPTEALPAVALRIAAAPDPHEAPAAAPGERRKTASQGLDEADVARGGSMATMTGADPSTVGTRPCEEVPSQALGETIHERGGRAPLLGSLAPELVAAVVRDAGAWAADRPQMAPEVPGKTENAPGETLAPGATGTDLDPALTREGDSGEAKPESVGIAEMGGSLRSALFPSGAADAGESRPQMAPEVPESGESAPENAMRAGSTDDGNAGAAQSLAPCGEAPPQDAPEPERADRSQNAPEPFEIAPVVTVRVPSETPGVFRLVKLRMERNGIKACA